MKCCTANRQPTNPLSPIQTVSAGISCATWNKAASWRKRIMSRYQISHRNATGCQLNVIYRQRHYVATGYHSASHHERFCGVTVSVAYAAKHYLRSRKWRLSVTVRRTIVSFVSSNSESCLAFLSSWEITQRWMLVLYRRFGTAKRKKHTLWTAPLLISRRERGLFYTVLNYTFFQVYHCLCRIGGRTATAITHCSVSELKFIT